MQTQPKFTDKQWAEIYYALEHKLTSPAVSNDPEWIGELKDIQIAILDSHITV
jgi:hypothetical protein